MVALVCERPVHRVSILPNRDALGICEFRKGVQRPSDDWIETEILIALAGMAAEARFTGNYDRGAAGQDLKHARKLMLYRATERSLERFERRMMGKVEHLLNDEHHWRAVEWIATELLKTGMISGRAAKHFYELATRSE